MDPAWEFSDDLFAIVGKDGLLRAVNSAWERTLGWAADELVGRSPIEFSHAEDPSELLQIRRSAYLEGRVEDLELRYRHRDGSDRWLRWSGYCDQDLWYLVGKDVTRARDERDRARRDGRARALLCALRDGFSVIDCDGRILEVNERLCEMTGFGANELVGAVAPFPYWAPEAHEHNLSALRAAREDGVVHHELVFQRRDGERFPVSLDVSPLTGDEEGFLAVIRDLTDQVREREELREAHMVARLSSWEWDLADDSIELSGGLVEPGDLAASPNLEEVLSMVQAPYDAPVRESLRGLVAGETDEVVLEYPVSAQSPDVTWVETRARPVRDASGGVVRVRGTSQDVTSRKLAELSLRRSEDRLAQAQRVARIGSFEVDYRTGELTLSSELHRLLGREPGSVSHVRDASDLLPSEDTERFRQIVAQTVQDGRPRELQHGYLRGGKLRQAESRMEPLVADGRRYGVRGTLQDITERKLYEREIHLQASLLDAVDVAVIATDLKGTVTHWNRGAERMYGWTRATTMGQPISTLTVGPQDGGQAKEIMQTVRRAGQWDGEFEVTRADGTSFPAYVHNSLFRDLDDRPCGVVGVSVDISERVQGERQLRAARDYQRAITDSIGEGLFTLDMEGRLIYINRAAEEMLGWTRAELAGRVMHDLTHYRREDGSPYPIEDCPYMQVRRTGEPVSLAEDVMIRKDGTKLPVETNAAPFETADGVRGSVVVFRDISERKAQEMRMQRELESLSWVGRVRDALARDRFVLHAQPIMDLATGETVQHELLIRMLDEAGGVIAPGNFLPAAEEYGLIADIDRWVMRQAIELAGQGHAVELNLSAQSISAPGLIEYFRSELRRTGADPSLIVVELTETALVSDEAAAEAFIERVGSLGCKLALDDFGTGYGGFSYLKRLPVDFLKIDMEFVRDLLTNEASRHVVAAVVSLARGFGQQTVAEGVEDPQTLALLHDFGVDFAQGYGLGRPVPVAEALGAGPAA